MRMVKLKTYSSVLIEDNIILKFKLLFNFRAPSAEFQLKLRNIIIKLRAVILPFFDNWTYSKILFQGRRNFGTVYQKENGNPPATVILLNSKDNFNKRFWENIHFGRVMVWYGANQMIIHFSKASILLYSRYSIHIFIQIILLENSWCSKELNKLCSPNSRDDLCLLFLLPWYVIPCCHAVWQHMGPEYGLQR